MPGDRQARAGRAPVRSGDLFHAGVRRVGASRFLRAAPGSRSGLALRPQSARSFAGRVAYPARPRPAGRHLRQRADPPLPAQHLHHEGPNRRLSRARSPALHRRRGARVRALGRLRQARPGPCGDLARRAGLECAPGPLSAGRHRRSFLRRRRPQPHRARFGRARRRREAPVLHQPDRPGRRLDGQGRRASMPKASSCAADCRRCSRRLSAPSSIRVSTSE